MVLSDPGGGFSFSEDGMASNPILPGDLAGLKIIGQISKESDEIVLLSDGRAIWINQDGLGDGQGFWIDIFHWKPAANAKS